MFNYNISNCIMSQDGYRPSFRDSFAMDGTIDLYIETLTGTAFEMTVSPFDTVLSIKYKIERVEGIPASQQHLLYNMTELDDSACLIDYSIRDGATLKLVLSMRGGPISTRRLPLGEEIGWREISDLARSSQEDVLEHLPPGARVTVLVFREGDQVNLFRVIENDDGSYTPLSESWSGSSIRNLFAEEDSDEANKRLQENSVTMGKMKELQSKMEKLSLQKKPKKTLPRVSATKKPLLSRRNASQSQSHKSASIEPKESIHKKSHQNSLHLPQINTSEGPSSSLLQSSRSSYLSTSSITQLQHPSRSREYRISRRDKNPESRGHTPRQSGHLPNIKHKFNEKCSQNSSMERPKSASVNEAVIPASNVTIVEEEDVDTLNSFPQRVVSSKEETLMTVSQLPVNNVGSGGPYRLSRFLIEEREDRPKTSPDSLTKQQKATQEICDIISETKWHRRQPRITCSNSQLDLSGESHVNYVDGSFVHKEKSVDDTTLDVNIRSPRYGRRSLVVPVQSTKVTRSEDKLPQDLYCPTMMSNEERKETRRRLPLAVQPVVKPTEKVEPSPKKPAPVRTRCAQCRKRLNITNVYTCRCNQLFCSAHRHCESHQCTFDYKSHGRKLIQAANPVVSAPKLPKI